MREVPKDLAIEIPPDQLVNEGIQLLSGGGMRLGSLFDHGEDGARRERSEGEVGRKAGGAVPGGEIPVGVVGQGAGSRKLLELVAPPPEWTALPEGISSPLR